MDIKDSYLHGTVGVVKSISVAADKLSYKLADVAGTTKTVTLPLATQAANGLLSKEDKKKLDNMIATKVANDLILKINSGTTEGTSLYTYNGSAAKTLDIKSGTGIGFTNNAGSLQIYNSGVRSIATGTTNGTISVNTNGTSANVTVKGLGSAAYTASDLYQKQATFVNSNTDTVAYKKVTISKNITDGYGIWIHSRYQHYLLNSGLVGGTTIGNSLWELGTNFNNDTPSTARHIHVKMVATSSSSTVTLYTAVEGYCYMQIVSSGTITISDSSQSEYESINSGTAGWVACQSAKWTDTTYNVVSNSANGLAPKVISTNTATVGSAYYVLASTNGSATPSWYKLPATAFANDDTKVTQTNTTGSAQYRVLLSGRDNDTTETTNARKSSKLQFNPSTGNLINKGDITINCTGESDKFLNFTTSTTHSWRLGHLASGNGNANYFVIQSSKDTENTWTDVLRLGLINLEATFASTVIAPTFQGNLDGTYINKLTGYSKATSAADLAATDTLNVALGKLEYKADTVYDWYKSVTGTDNDDIINKWEEIVDFIDSVKEGTDITDEFVTRKTAQTITGEKTFTNKITIETTGANKTPKVVFDEYYNSSNPSWISEIASDYYGTNICETTGFTHGFYITLGRSGFDNLIILNSSKNPIARISKDLGHWFDGNTTIKGSLTASNIFAPGGTLSLGSIESFVIKKTSNTHAMIAFQGRTSDSDNTNIKYGYLGISGKNKPVFGEVNEEGTTVTAYRTLLHTGNYSTILDGRYLPLAGGTMNNGAIIKFNKNGGLRQTTDTTSNAVTIVQWYKGTDKDDNYSYAAQIGWHNTGDTDGAIYLVPNPQNTNPWGGSVGLYIGKTQFKWNNKVIIHAGNYTYYLPFLNSSSTHATNSSVIYAPTTAGTKNQVLISNGSGAPVWTDQSNLSVGYATNWSRSVYWNASTTVGSWSRILTIQNYANILLSTNWSQTSQAVQHLYLICTGHKSAKVVQLGCNNYSGYSTVKIRITRETDVKFHVEVYNSYGYNGATTIPIACRATNIGTQAVLTTITTNTAGSGTEVSSLTSHYNIAKNLHSEWSSNGMFYIVGTGDTAGTWLGSHSEIKSYYTGLIIAYKIPIAGASTTTLNINNLGAKTCYINTSKLTTHYGVGSVAILVYDGTYFRAADYWDGNSYAYVRQYTTDSANAEYPLLFRYNTAAPTANGYVTEYTRYDSGITINPSTNTITATKFKGTATQVDCTATADDVTRPIVLTNTSSKLYYTTKATINYKTGNITAPTFTGNLTGTADSASKLKTARTLTVGNLAKTFDGSANVSWPLHDILFSSTAIGTSASWDIYTPGVYYVSSSGAFTGAGNPESTNGGLTPYRYGQLIVSRAGNGGVAQFYISHNDSSNDKHYSIKYRTGWNNAYISSWNSILDSSNYDQFTVKKDGTGATGTWGINVTGRASYLTTNATKNLGLNGTLQLIASSAPFGDTVDEWNSPYGNFTNDSGTKFDFGNIIRLRYSENYYYDFWFDANNYSISYRHIINNASFGWTTLLDSTNISKYAAGKLSSTTIVDAKAFSLSSATWTDTGYTFASLVTGTYAVQVTFGTTLVASGIMSVYKNLSDTAGDEIPLHVYGTAGWRPYLRTYANKLQISSNDVSATSRTVTIKIAQIL